MNSKTAQNRPPQRPVSRLSAAIRRIGITRKRWRQPRTRGEALIDILSLAVAVVTSVFVSFYLVLGLEAQALASLGVLLFATVAFAAHHAGHPLLGKHIVIGGLNVSIFAFAAHLGTESDIHTAFAITLAYAALVFERREWQHAAIALLQPFAYLSILFFAEVRLFEELKPGPEIISLVKTFMAYCVGFCLLVPLALFVRLTRSLETQAVEAQESLRIEARLARILHELTAIANHATELPTALEQARGAIAAFTGWDAGPVHWLAGRPQHEAKSETSRCILCDTVRISERAEIFSLASKEERCSFVGERGGVAVAVPIPALGDVVATVLFRSREEEEPSAELLRTLTMTGRALGIVQERAVAQSRVAESHMKMVAAAKMATLGEMAAGIAHEINNPLAVIQGYLQRIRKASVQAAGYRQIDEAVEATHMTIKRITTIVSGLKAFARESTADPFELVTVGRIVDDTLALSRERFRSEGIRLEVSKPGADLTLSCRPTEISQVLINLLNNAYDAVKDESERCVSLEILEEGKELKIVVADSGPGIPEALREKVLQPFFTTKPVGQGTGLGLSISKGIVEAHGGAIRFEEDEASALRQRVVISLPRASAELYA